MVDSKAAGNAPLAGATDGTQLAYPFDTPVRFYADLARQALAVTARGLQAQADYVKDLATCENPADVLTCSNVYACHILDACLEAGRNAAASTRHQPQG
ncbi:Phasin protein [Hyphomicrobiales bacterium]|nr:Phasin protein [Hyphomicrobiales bacterium]CAH1695248.1 Phasin protein [Hyphomicrobiales bacterium]